MQQTRRMRAERLVHHALDVVRRHTGCRERLSGFLESIRDDVGMTAAALRVRDGAQFPFCTAVGFPGAFIDAQSSLGATEAIAEHAADRVRTPDGFSTFRTMTVRDASDVVAMVYLGDPRSDIISAADLETLRGLFDLVASAGCDRVNESESIFFAAFHRSPGMFAITTFEDARFVDVNAQFLEASGFSRDELIGRTAMELGVWPDPELGRRLREGVASHGSTGTFEARYRRKDGRIGIGLASAAKIRVRGVDCLLTETVDITERKRMEQALIASESRLRQAAEAAGFGTWARDSNGSTERSPEVLALYGLEPGTELPVDADEVPLAMHPADREAFLAAARQASDPRGSGILDVEFRVRHPTGELRWLRVRGRVSFVDGQPQSAHGIVHDVTDRRRAAKDLELFKSSVDHAPHCVYWLAPDGRFIYANREGCRALGYSRDELLRLHIHDVNPRATPERWQEIWDTLRANGLRASESIHRRKDGSFFPVEILSAYHKFGDQEYCNGFAIDISERRHAEQEREALQAQLLQAQKMESVGRLAGGVAHDFNNMLEVILGNTELALAQLTPGTPLVTELAEIRAAGERSAELVRQLLAFARQQMAEPRLVDLNDIVMGMLKMLRRLIGENIDLVWEPGHDVWPVKIDPSQVSQILANLAVNARDAITGVGTLRISTSNVTLDTAQRSQHGESGDGEYVVLTVTDSGAGMSEETKQHLFEPFYTTKPVGVGTGLGLATVYGIVSQNHGFIDVVSDLGAGSMFRIHLVRYRGDVVVAPSHAPSHAPSEAAPEACETILLVEDEPAILRVCRRLLERQGYRVLTAGLPSNALQIAASHPDQIDLVIVDVVMPEMSGSDLAERLRTLKPGLRALFMSGYPANFVTREGMVNEGIHFLQKPFTGPSLAAKVREVLRRNP